jgi:putative phosphoesterase
MMRLPTSGDLAESPVERRAGWKFQRSQRAQRTVISDGDIMAPSSSGRFAMTTEPSLPAAEAVAQPTRVEARRIAFLSDDHNAQADGSDFPDEALAAFAGVDLIVHLGHMGVREQLARGVLERLGKVAPVLAVRDYSTKADKTRFITPAEGTRVAGLARVIEASGLRIGAIHNLALPPGPEIPTPPAGLPELVPGRVRAIVKEKFGGDVDVVAYASTHRAVALVADGILFVNPGSPTYPKGPGYTAGRQLGTIGILEISGGVPAFEIVDLRHFAAEGAPQEKTAVAAM